MTQPKLKLGSLYKFTFRDHCTDSNKSPEKATQMGDECVYAVGMYVGRSRHYIVLATFYDDEMSSNCDTTRILHNCVTKIEELIPRVVKK
jgi:hypothetical protein